MSANPNRLYWDSCVFLDYINANPDHLPTIDALLAQATRGEIIIMTSVVSITEVSFAQVEKTGGFEQAHADRIDDLWTDQNVVRMVDFFPALAYRARNVMREVIGGGGKLRPMDAIHLASAVHAQCSVLHTYDVGLIGLSGRFSIVIKEPETPQLGLPV